MKFDRTDFLVLLSVALTGLTIASCNLIWTIEDINKLDIEFNSLRTEYRQTEARVKTLEKQLNDIKIEIDELSK